MAIDSVSVANMPYWNVLPMGVTNFGGDTQVFTVDNYSSGQIGCTLNPMGLAAVNGYGQPTLYNNWGYTPSPNNPFMDGMNRNAEQISAGLAKQSIHTSLQTIAIAKQRLNAMLMQPGFEKQQKKIEKLLEKLDKQEEKLNDLLSETELTPAETLKKARAIENDIRKIIADIAKIKPGSSSSAADGDDEVDGEDDVDDVEPAEDEDEDGIGDYPTYSDESLILADDFKKAVYYTWGTDDELFNKVCDQIDQDNVIDVMLAWQDNHALTDNESFMTAFFKDADGKQGRVYGRKIANALRLEARELGVFQQCREDFNAIFKELDRADGFFGYDVDNDIAKHYDNIIKVIAEKKGQPYNTSEFKY